MRSIRPTRLTAVLASTLTLAGFAAGCTGRLDDTSGAPTAGESGAPPTSTVAAATTLPAPKGDGMPLVQASSLGDTDLIPTTETERS